MNDQRRLHFPVAICFALVLVACGPDGPLEPDNGGWGKVMRPTSGPRYHEIKVDDVSIDVRLALTTEQRHQGLGGVLSLGNKQGMLFVYRDPMLRNFWMKDCLIALDIAYIDEQGIIFQVSTLAPPPSGTPDILVPHVPSSAACTMVLEMAAGFFKRHGLRVGSRVTIPGTVPIHRVE